MNTTPLAPAAYAVRSIERSHWNETQLSLDLLNYVAQHQPCTFITLFELEASPDKTAQAHNKLRDRLCYLVQTKRLVAVGVRQGRQYSLGPRAYPVTQNRREQVQRLVREQVLRRLEHDAPRPATSVATPDRYNRLHGAPYVPPVAHCPRAGGLDYQRIASVGYAC
jgi:hypothetical protein